MPMFYKPGLPRRNRVRGKDVEVMGAVFEGSNLGEFLGNIERITGAYIVPAEPPKYFRYYQSRYAKEHVLVDIHVERNGEWICPRQDLSFPLLPTDVLLAGELEC